MNRTDTAPTGVGASLGKTTVSTAKYNPGPSERQALAVEWWRRQAELRANGLRAAYDYVKSLYRGGLL
jgi:hypothetical protein